MDAFEYAKPSNVKEAIGLLGSGWEQASVFAGGTDLLSLLKDNVEETKRLVNVKGIAGLNRIHETSVGVHIGAAVTMEELISSRVIRGQFPAIVDAAEGIRSPQLHNMITVGGWLCQRPRCWYYRNGFGLLALDKNGNSLVTQGDNRYHAIFGNSGPAKFISPTSFGPALVALDGNIRIEGPSGAREIAADKFFVIPEKPGEREHALAPNEIVTEITIPAASRGMRSAMYDVRQKEGLDWPLTTAAVALRMRGDTVETARIVLGHVAPKPWPAEDASKWLAGKAINEENAAKAGDAAAQGATPLSRNGYKVQLVRVAVKRALLAAAKREA
ncbi:MAG TPA: FAD binding domain-containing protein [Candidatus Limnocylindrales bacterium]|nr:FAD binding domain-containing protein [Candidatus Limnocylindrales bacterium]